MQPNYNDNTVQYTRHNTTTTPNTRRDWELNSVKPWQVQGDAVEL